MFESPFIHFGIETGKTIGTTEDREVEVISSQMKHQPVFFK